MNEGLFTAYQNLPGWQRLLERVSGAGCTALYEIAEGERPFLAAALAHKTGRPVCWSRRRSWWRKGRRRISNG